MPSEESNNKFCRFCGIEKLVSEFGKKKNSKNGIRNMCKACHSKRSKERKAEYRDRVSDIKRKTPCEDCGMSYDTEVMEFDHIESRGAKVSSISAMVDNRNGWKTILKEIDKCELVCANCHRMRTKHRREKLAEKVAISV